MMRVCVYALATGSVPDDVGFTFTNITTDQVPGYPAATTRDISRRLEVRYSGFMGKQGRAFVLA